MKRILIAAAVFLAGIGLASAQGQFPYPSANFLSGTASGADTSTLSASLTPTGGRTAYACGLFIGGLGATAIANVVPSLSVASGTINLAYSMPAGATVPAVPVFIFFNDQCLPGTAGSAITLTVPGAAGNTSTVISIWGYQQ